jgi:hypothetical protein
LIDTFSSQWFGHFSVAVSVKTVGIVGIVRHFFVGVSVEIAGIVVAIRRSSVGIVGIVRHFFVGVSVEIAQQDAKITMWLSGKFT